MWDCSNRYKNAFIAVKSASSKEELSDLLCGDECIKSITDKCLDDIFENINDIELAKRKLTNLEKFVDEAAQFVLSDDYEEYLRKTTLLWSAIKNGFYCDYDEFSKYSDEELKAKFIMLMMNNIRHKSDTPSCGVVYVIEYENGICKIGKTTDIETRFKTLSKMSSSKVTGKLFFTNSTANYSKIEKEVHNALKEHRSHGEFFNIAFDEAVSVVEKFYDKHSKTTVRDK